MQLSDNRGVKKDPGLQKSLFASSGNDKFLRPCYACVVRTAEKSDCKQQQQSVVFFEYCNGAL